MLAESRPGSGKRFPWTVAYALIVMVVTALLFAPMFAGQPVMNGFFDVRAHTMPLALVAGQALRGGELPQWNQSMFCGTSLAASAGATYFYPPLLLLCLLPPELLLRALGWLHLLHVLLAAVGAYLLMRELIRVRFWSVYAALAYWLSYPLLVNLCQSGCGNNYLAFLSLPWWLYFNVTAARRPWLANVLLQTIVLAGLLLGTHLQLALYTLGLGGMLSLLLAATGGKWRAVGRQALLLATSLLLAGMLAAPRLLPFIVEVAAAGSAGISVRQYLEDFSTPPRQLIRVAAPYLFGAHEAAFGGDQLHIFESFPVFCGTGTILLAASGFLYGGWCRKTRIWYGATAVIVLAVLGTPLTVVHYLLTGGTSLVFSRLAFFLVLPLTVLAGLAGCRASRDAGRAGADRRLLLVAAVACGLTALIAAVMTPAERAVCAPLPLVAGAWLLAAAGFTLLAFRLPRLREAMLLALLLAELGVVGWHLTYGFYSLWAPLPVAARENLPAGGAAALAAGERMISAAYWQPNRHCLVGWRSSGGYDSLPPVWLAELYTNGLPLSREERRILLPDTPRLWQLTATRLAQDASGAWQNIPQALPRARLVFAARQAATDSEALALLRADDFPVADCAVVTDDLSLPPQAEPAAGTVAIIAESANAVILAVTTSSRCLVLLADGWHPGWRAEVDGVPVRSYRVNHAFRGVLVDPGAHRVDWQFTQPGLRLGLVLGGLALGVVGILAAMLLAQLWRARGKLPADPPPATAGTARPGGAR